MSIIIRPLSSDDHINWKPLWAGYLEFYKATDDVSEAQSQHTWEIITGDSKEIMGLGAFDETGKMIGFTHYLYHASTWAKEGYCYLEDLYVEPSLRGGGVGEKLIKAVCEIAKEDNKAKVYWLTQNENFRGRGLYNKVAGSSEFVHYEIEL